MRLIACIFVMGLTGAGLVTAQQPRGPGGPPPRSQNGGPEMRGGMRGPMSAADIEKLLSRMPAERREFIQRLHDEIMSLPEAERRARLQQYKQRLGMAPGGGQGIPEEIRGKFQGGLELWGFHRLRLRVVQSATLRVLNRNPEIRDELSKLDRPARIERVRQLVQDEMTRVIRWVYMPERFREDVRQGKQLSKADVDAMMAEIAAARRLAVTNAIEAYKDVDGRAKLRELAVDPAFVDRMVYEFGFIDTDVGSLTKAEHRERRYQMHLHVVLKLERVKDRGDGADREFGPENRPRRPDGRGPEGRGPEGRRPVGSEGNRPGMPGGGPGRGEGRPGAKPGEEGDAPIRRPGGPRNGRPERDAPEQPREPVKPIE